MEARDHWPAIVELVDHLAAHSLLQGEEPEVILQALREREEKTSTGIGHGVAIPHAFSDRTSSVIAVFGRSREGIDFDAIDNGPVHFIVLFIVPRAQYHLHLRTLAAIAKLLNNGEVRAQLEAAQDSAEILEVLARRSPRA
jgi:mannitol/fructose-specific phosphotransferase system IIA component (Ntr-type)